MRHTHEREIDGTRWTVNEFSATEGLRLLTRLTKLCGAPVAKLLGSIPKGGVASLLDSEIDFGALGAAVMELVSVLDEREVEELAKRILANTLAGGEDCGRRFDTVFQGRYATLGKVVMFVLEVNYKVPLSDLLQAGSAGAPAPAASAKR